MKSGKLILVALGLAFGLASSAGQAQAQPLNVCYDAYFENAGWSGQKCDGEDAGPGGRRMMHFGAWSYTPGLSICYRVKLASGGWQAPLCDGHQVGNGQSPIVAIQAWSANLDPNQSLFMAVSSAGHGWNPYTFDGHPTGDLTSKKRAIEMITLFVNGGRDPALWYNYTLKGGDPHVAGVLATPDGQVGWQFGSVFTAVNISGPWRWLNTGFTGAPTADGGEVRLRVDRYNNVTAAEYLGPWVGNSRKYINLGSGNRFPNGDPAQYAQ